MPRTVILLHRLPDGTSHFDWLLEAPDRPGLLTFRSAARPDDPALMRLEATPLADHRPLYLDYQGPVSGGRGTVERLAAGAYQDLTAAPGSLSFLFRFPPHPWRRARARPAAAEEPWIFDLDDPPPSDILSTTSS